MRPIEDMATPTMLRHYSSDNLQQRDSKYVVSKSGVLYPQEALWETTLFIPTIATEIG